MWDRGYTPSTLAPVLAAHGYLLDATWADVTGAPYGDDADDLAVLARRQ
jgi:hypothetical protein